MSIQDQLYEKMSGEYALFKEELKRRPPGEIIEKAYEIAFKEEILAFFDDSKFIYDDIAVTLLGLSHPLQELYNGWLDADSEYLDNVRDSITETIREITEHPERFDVAGEKSTPTAATIYGEVQAGDWVISAGNNDYEYLIGTVKEIVKLGTPEHAAETTNITDSVHVDFTAFDYPPERIAEIEAHFSDLYGEPKTFDEIAMDDVIMAPGMLISISNLSDDEITRMGNLRANCESFCKCFTAPNPQNEKHAELMERLDKNLADYHSHLEGYGTRELIDMTHKINAMSEAYSYLSYRGFEDDELDFLLQFQNPLEVVAEGWRDYNYDTHNEMGFALDTVLRHKQDWLDSYPLMSSTAATEPGAGQPPEKAEPSVEKAKQTLAEKLQAAGEKAKAQDTNKNMTSRKREERE